MSLRGGPDNDTFNVGNGSLNSLNGLLDIQGGGQDAGTVVAQSFTNAAGTANNNLNLIGDTLNVNDGTTATATTYALTSQTLASNSFGAGSGSPQLGYGGIESLTLNAAAGNDTVIVSSTPDAANVTLNGGAGQNTFTVATTGSANNLSINGNGSGDTFTIQGTGSNPYVVLQGTAGANTFNLQADGSGTGGVQLLGGADNDQFNLGNGTLAGLLSLMDIEGGTHDATPVSSLASIVSPASATPVPCNPNPVGDSLFLGDQSASGTGVYSLTATTIAFGGATPLLGYSSVQSLVISGANGGDTMSVTTTPASANVTLNGGTGANTYTIQTTGASTNLTINGNVGIDTITIQNTGANPFVVANGGAGNNVFNLQADATGGGVSLTGGADNDTFNLGTGTLAGLNSTLFVNGGAHDGVLVSTQSIINDAGTVNNNAIAVGDTLNLLDQTNSSARVYALTTNTFQFGGAAPQLGYSNIQSLVLRGSTGGNTINVASTPDNANITLDGGTGTDTVTITNTGANNNLAINGGAGNDTYTIANTGALPFVIATGGSGINTFNLLDNGTGGGLSLVGGPHNDTFNLGTGTLAGLSSLLDIKGLANDNALVGTQTISNAAGTRTNNALAVGDTINFMDQTDSLATAYTLNKTTFQFADGAGSSPQALGFAGVETINLNAASGGNNVRITNTPDSANINVNAGTGSNTFNVTTTGDDSNVFIQSNSATGNNDTFTIAGTGLAPFFVANGGAGLNTFNLQSSGSGGAVKLVGGPKNDTYNLGSAGGKLGGINSLIDINGGAGHDPGNAPGKDIFSSIGTYPSNPIAIGDTLNFADQGNAQNAAYTLTVNTFQFGGASPQVGYENIQSLGFSGGSGSNSLTAQSMPDSATVSLTTGTGLNAVKIVTTGNNDNLFINSATSSGTTDIVNTGQGAYIDANGGVGLDALFLNASGTGSAVALSGSHVAVGHQSNVADNTGAAFQTIHGAVSVIGQGTNQNLPTVVIDDGGDPTGSAYSLTFESNRITGFGSKQGISYTQEASVNVWLGGQSNQLQLLSSISGSTTIQSTHAEPDVFDVAGTPTSLQGTVTLHGSVGGNQFRFANGAGFTNGILIGGLGAGEPEYANMLNYAAYRSPIGVNLQNHSATGTSLVMGIGSVLGGFGNNTLVGDSASNVLNGGPADDTIIAGNGSTSYLYGGTGNDRLTAGSGGFDFVDGGTGSDTLRGGNGGVDYLYGGIAGGPGEVDTIVGGLAQTFIVVNSPADLNNGSTTITVQSGGGGNLVILTVQLPQPQFLGGVPAFPGLPKAMPLNDDCCWRRLHGEHMRSRGGAGP